MILLCDVMGERNKPLIAVVLSRTSFIPLFCLLVVHLFLLDVVRQVIHCSVPLLIPVAFITQKAAFFEGMKGLV